MFCWALETSWTTSEKRLPPRGLRAVARRRALPAHAALQTFSLLATPGAYYALVYRWRWEVRPGLGRDAAPDGTEYSWFILN